MSANLLQDATHQLAVHWVEEDPAVAGVCLQETENGPQLLVLWSASAPVQQDGPDTLNGIPVMYQTWGQGYYLHNLVWMVADAD